MLDLLRADLARLEAIKSRQGFRLLVESLLFDNGFNAVVLYRIAHWFRSQGVPFLGPLFGRLSVLLTGAEIAPGTEIGPGLMISHGQGIVIGQWSKLGSGVTLLHQVTLGGPSIRRTEEMPRVGDDVFIGAGAKLIGGITVGDGAFIGVNAVVAQDVPAGSKVVAESGIRIQPPDPESGSPKPAAPVEP